MTGQGGQPAAEDEHREPLQPPPDAAAWEKAAAEAAVSQLTSVRATAEKWAGTVTALLGVFSTVAIVTGTDVLKDIPEAIVRWAIVVIVVASGLAAGASIYLAAKAAQGTLTLITNWNGQTYRAAVNAKTTEAVDALKKSRIAGLIAASLVFVIGVVSLIAGTIPQSTSKQKVLFIGKEGTLICGDLEVGADGRGEVAGEVVTGASEIAIVTKC